MKTRTWSASGLAAGLLAIALLACGDAPSPGPERTGATSAALCSVSPQVNGTCAPEGETFLFPASQVWNDPNWVDVAHLACGATSCAPGTDVTAAIKTAIASLPSGGVVYLRKGRYTLSGSIVLRSAGVEIMGEDPATTTIVWAAPHPAPAAPCDPVVPGQDMFVLDGAGASGISRLTLDGGAVGAWNQPGYLLGARSAIHAIDSLTAKVGGSYDLRFNDLIIRAVSYGIVWGSLTVNVHPSPACNADLYRSFPTTPADSGSNNGDGVIERVVFVNIPGIASSEAGSYNVVDILNRDSTFVNVDVGIMQSDAYNLTAFGNNFHSSKTADIWISSQSSSSIRNNYSDGSALFVHANRGWQGRVSIVGNQVNGTAGSSATALRLSSGSNVVMANRFRTRPGATGPVIDLMPTGEVCPPSTLVPGPNDSYAQPDYTFGYNQFTVSPDAAYQLGAVSPTDCATTALSVKQRVFAVAPDLYGVQLSSATAPQPVAIPPTPTDQGRVEIAIPNSSNPNGTDVTPQVLAAVATASCDPAHRYVLHFGVGAYILSSTITVPGGLDLAVVGDSAYFTRLFWRGAAAGAPPMFDLLSPAKTTFAKIQIRGDQAQTPVSGIRAAMPDTPSSRTYGDLLRIQQYDVGGSFTTNRATVLLRSAYAAFNDVGYEVSGDGTDVAGKMPGVRVELASTTGDVQSSFRVKSFGKLILESGDSEGPCPGALLDASQSGFVTVGGATRFITGPVARPGYEPNFRIQDGFRGRLSLVNIETLPQIVNESGQLSQPSVLALGVEQDSWHTWWSAPQPSYHGPGPACQFFDVCTKYPRCRDATAPCSLANGSQIHTAVINSTGLNDAFRGPNACPIDPWEPFLDLNCANQVDPSIPDLPAFAQTMLADYLSAVPVVSYPPRWSPALTSSSDCPGPTDADLRLIHVNLVGASLPTLGGTGLLLR